MSAEVIWLEGAGVRAGIVPRLGGRMLSLTFDGIELLWRNAGLIDEALVPLVAPVELGADATFSDWQNWGGDKTWPAPQGWGGNGAWSGPPDGVLDAGPYSVKSRGPGEMVVIESAADPKSGLTITRGITLHNNAPRVTVASTLTNTSLSAVTWSAWEVAQFAVSLDDVGHSSAGVYVEVSPGRGASSIELMSPVGTIPVVDVSTTLAYVPFVSAVGKVGFPRASGRIGLLRADGLSVQGDFRVETGAKYADQSPFQLWMQVPVTADLPGLPGLRPDAFLVEIEPLSPLTKLEPGESVTLTVDWTLGRPLSSAVREV